MDVHIHYMNLLTNYNSKDTLKQDIYNLVSFDRLDKNYKYRLYVKFNSKS